MKGKKFFLTTGVLLCVTGFSVWYLFISRTVRAEEVVNPSARPIPTFEVAETMINSLRTFPGTVRASNRVEMAFSIDGLLVELEAVEGTSVAKGEVVARLDSRDATNSYEAAKARYEIAKKDLERSQQLIKREVIPLAEFDTAKSNFDIAAAEMRIRKKGLDDTVLNAPFDGVVSKRYVENYQHIKAKDNILSLKDISRIDVVVQVPERLISLGGRDNFSNVNIRFDALPDKWYEAKIKEFSIESDPVTRTYEVVVSLEPPEDLEILPGMTATVTVPTMDNGGQPANNTIVVPLVSVVGGGANSSFVWEIPAKGGAPVKKEVEIGRIIKDGIEIRAGLEAGELIAVAGVHSLTDEMLVRPAVGDREGLDQ